jgi:aminomethyltransferase
MKKTSLNQTHRNQGAKMVEFAAFDMPIQYSEGMLKEHQWVRSGNVGIFDVSHMGQFFIEGKEVVKFLSFITPTDFSLSQINQAKYTVLTNENGGIIDDLIITKISDEKFFIVLNAACKEKDESWIRKHLPITVKLSEASDRSLIAVQGEKSEQILNQLILKSDLSNLAYMNIGFYQLKNPQNQNDAEIFISRTGYTGEDGFEISIKNSEAEKFWLELSNFAEVKPIGLGARDSLRLEMGYPLYGHDLDDTTSPIEAALSWVVSKSNHNFIGSERILAEKISGVKRKRMGVKLLENGIAREGSEVKKEEKKIGFLSSGGFSPTLKLSIGQGYFETDSAKIGDSVSVIVRDREIKAVLTSPTFIEAKTKSLKK